MRGRTEAAIESRSDGFREHGLRTADGLADRADRSESRARGTHPHHRLLRTPDSCTDGELVTLALNGGAAAFGHLMRRHARHLRGVVARRLRDPEDVSDAIQDTQLAVWRALQHYDAGRPFEAWLTTIAINKCRDSARRRAAQLGMLSQLRAGANPDCWPAVEERGIERLLIGKESIHCLGKALRALPAPLRAPLLLTTVRERSQAAAARELGLTRKAVEMRVRRARQHLARSLEAVYA